MWRKRHLYLAMRSIYIRLRLGPAAAPLIVRMRTRLGGVAIVCDYPHPAILNRDYSIEYRKCSGGSRIFQMGGRCFVTNGGAHILFSGKKCMKLKEIGLKWGGARLLVPCYSKITIFL